MSLLNKNDGLGKALLYISLIGASVLIIRFLVWADSFGTSLLYVALPFTLSLVLYYATPITDGTNWKKRFWNNLRGSLIIMLAVSIIVMEGYVCVLMFMPIYFFIMFLGFLVDYFRHRSKKGALHVQAIPALIVLLSFEGVFDATTFNRYNEVTYTRVINADVRAIKQKLAQPINLTDDRHWFLTVFPMPENIHAASLNQGDTHTIDFVYHRWFAANTHEGQMQVTLEEVTDAHIKTSIQDTSYISNYMTLHGTELNFEPLGSNKTSVSLTVRFDRILDPVWYFEPLERFAVKKSAEFLIDELLTKQV